MRFSSTFLLGLWFLSASVACFAEVSPELRAVVDYQKKNKNAVLKTLQQEALRLKRSGDAEGAKAAKAMEKDVRSGRALYLPKLTPNGEMAGTVEVERVLQQTDGGYWIQTSVPRLENTSVNVRTGLPGTSPMAVGWVYYPEKIFVETSQEPKAGGRILVRRAGRNYVEISDAEVQEATALLNDSRREAAARNSAGQKEELAPVD